MSGTFPLITRVLEHEQDAEKIAEELRRDLAAVTPDAQTLRQLGAQEVAFSGEDIIAVIGLRKGGYRSGLENKQERQEGSYHNIPLFQG